MNGRRSNAARTGIDRAPRTDAPEHGSAPAAGRLRPGDPRRYPPGLFDLGPAALRAYEQMLSQWADPNQWAQWLKAMTPSSRPGAPDATDPLTGLARAAAAMWYGAYTPGAGFPAGTADPAATGDASGSANGGHIHRCDSGTLTASDIEEIAKTCTGISLGRKAELTARGEKKAQDLGLRVVRDS